MLFVIINLPLTGRDAREFANAPQYGTRDESGTCLNGPASGPV